MFKKALFSGFLLALMMPMMGFAQTGTQNASSVILQLQAQLQEMQLRLAALKTAQQNVQTSQTSVSETVQLLRSLRSGMSGDDVKALQALLASENNIYPEGLITGYFGPATARAVKRFQAKHGIEQIGNVGPKTLKKIAELLKEKPIRFESDDDDDDDDDRYENKNKNKSEKRLCAIVPPGHLIAPGYLKKNGERLIVPPCQVLPSGIIKQLPGATTSTTTVDTIAPVISEISAIDLTGTGAIVKWKTNEPSTTQVEYGTSSSYGLMTTLNSSLVTIHSVLIGGLTPSTTYHYRVWSKDANGNTASSTDATFATPALPDIASPIITDIHTSNLATSSVSIVWTTNETSDSKVYYSTSSPVNLSIAATASNSALVVSHSLNLTGLNASTTYYYVVSSKDASNNIATSSTQSVTTLP